jgi:hypothetical protein
MYHSDYLLTRFAQERLRTLHEEAATERHRPSLRKRLALQLQGWATRLEPELHGGKPKHSMG